MDPGQFLIEHGQLLACDRIPSDKLCRRNSELDIRMVNPSAVMRQLHRSVVLKRELCTKAKLSIFSSVYVPILTYGHECGIMNEKVRC